LTINIILYYLAVNQEVNLMTVLHAKLIEFVYIILSYRGIISNSIYLLKCYSKAEFA